MSALRTVIIRWLPVIAVGWLMSCGGPQSTVREVPALSPDFPQAVETLVESLSQHESIWPEAVPGVTPLAHKVKWQRETLFSIALWYTGSGENWQHLAKANPSIRPSRLQIGDTILIPEELLTTRQAMPADFLKPKSSKIKLSPPRRSASAPDAEQIPLYGPIENTPPAPNPKSGDLPVPLEPLD
jgi:hypothetical protein